MRLTSHRAVQSEIWEACDWYDERKDGLGDESFEEFERVLGLIGRSPLRFSPSTLSRRKAPMRRFPYVIYFRVSLSEIRVLAVCHEKRHPDYSKNRKE
jgi:plasmid stabilization system protein ParE